MQPQSRPDRSARPNRAQLRPQQPSANSRSADMSDNCHPAATPRPRRPYPRSRKWKNNRHDSLLEQTIPTTAAQQISVDPSATTPRPSIAPTASIPPPQTLTASIENGHVAYHPGSLHKPDVQLQPTALHGFNSQIQVNTSPSSSVLPHPLQHLQPPLPRQTSATHHQHHPQQIQQLQLHLDHQGHSQNVDHPNGSLLSTPISQPLINSSLPPHAADATAASPMDSTFHTHMPLNPQLHSTPEAPNHPSRDSVVQSHNPEASEDALFEAKTMLSTQPRPPSRHTTPDISQRGLVLSPPMQQTATTFAHLQAAAYSPAVVPSVAAAGNSDTEVLSDDKIAALASKIKASTDVNRARPLICQDITNSNADTLRITCLPRGVTYDRLCSMVEPFGEVEELAWSPENPNVCEVTYRDSSAAQEAKHFLGDALVTSDSEPPLKAELHSRDSSAQLFIGDLTPDITEELLEETFSQLVGEPVKATLKRDPESFSPIGYGFLSFRSESSASFALVTGHRAKIGNACVRVGRAERNTHLYVSELSPNVTMRELKERFEYFGGLVEEDTVIVQRSYAFVRYKNRGDAEKAKRALDKTDLNGFTSLRYGEVQNPNAIVAVQFHSSVPRPPNSLRDLLTSAFSKHGNCSVEIPRMSNGMWKKVAYVKFHGDYIASNLAALEAVQSIRFVSSLPVRCQFDREFIPRFYSREVVKKTGESNVPKPGMPVPYERRGVKLSQSKKNFARRQEFASNGPKGNSKRFQAEPGSRAGRHFRPEHNGSPADFVPVYVPISALQHPNQPMQAGSAQAVQGNPPAFHWPGRVLVPGNGPEGNIAHHAAPVNPPYAPFPHASEHVKTWK